MRGLVIACAVVGCVPYEDGAFRYAGDPFVGRRVKLDCLDVAIAPTQDPHAMGAVLAFTFGTHCSQVIGVDFSAIRAVGRYADGTRPLHAYDPSHELRALRLDPGSVGREEIAYLADDGTTPAAACIDVGSMETTETAPQHWICFGAWDLGGSGGQALGPAAPRGSNMYSSAVTRWPLSEEPEPEVVHMPAEAQTSIVMVGAYLADHITDRRRLVKALHDFVALRVSYDEAARNAEVFRPAQDAESVFERRFAVCEGYANLLEALGAAAGVDIRTIDGYAHDGDGGGGWHAWNAAKLDDGWVLIDATWDHVDAEHISTKYLMTPPGIFALTHDNGPDWQPAAPELTLDDFLATWRR